MRTYLLFLSASLVLAASACKGPESGQSSTESVEMVATIKDIMALVIDPNATALWNSVSSTTDLNGTTEKAPRTDEEWKVVRGYAMALVEAPNLLVMPGRKMARPGDKSQAPGIELEPEEMEALVNQDRKSFVQLARDLQETVLVALKAIDEKDAEALALAGGPIDAACEKCHKKYWYPNEGKGAKPTQ